MSSTSEKIECVGSEPQNRFKTSEYRAWQSMRKYCTSPKYKEYKYYGALGIKVCDRWLHSFFNFISDMGYKPSKKHGLSRRDNKGDFNKDNCYWATKEEQGNNRRNNKIYEVHGEKLTQTQLTKKYNIDQKTLQRRLLSGSFNNAVEECVAPAHSKTLYTYNEQTKNIKQWAEHFCIPVSKLHYRLRIAGWSFEKAIST